MASAMTSAWCACWDGFSPGGESFVQFLSNTPCSAPTGLGLSRPLLTALLCDLAVPRSFHFAVLSLGADGFEGRHRDQAGRRNSV